MDQDVNRPEDNRVEPLSLGEIGRLLRARREELGLTLGDIQAETKVRKRYLEAIEKGDDSEIPGEVYAKGFIRAYANFVGLDGMKLMKQYRLWKQEQRGDQEEDDPAEKPAPRVISSATFRRRSPVSLVLIVLGILLLGLALGFFGFRKLPILGQLLNPSTTTEERAGSGDNLSPNPGVESPGMAGSGGTGSTSGGEAPGTGEVPSSQKSGTDEQPEGTAPAEISILKKPGAGNEIFYAVTGTDRLVVTLSARERCWIRTWSDRSVITGIQATVPNPLPDFEGYLEAGTQRSWQADSRLVIVTGNSPAVELTVNGAYLGQIGEMGPNVLIFELVQEPGT